MAYNKQVINAETGVLETVELTEHQYRCERLGLPESTPEETVNAAWAAHVAALQAEQATQITRAEKVQLALENLKNIDMKNVQATLDKVTDPNAKLLIGRLIQVVRLLVTETLQGDD